ncbi:MAG: C15orf41 family protein [Methanosarcina mazei]|uniref:C15orf41 family protein n=1 Tax=Methanosarcina soligelidi TaxID=1036677 RepID=UPI00064E1CE7|nr:C15orf41 family protein [Methanosarcina soligelidi]
MDRQTYQKLYSSLHNFRDVFRLSEEDTRPPGMLATILNQKIVKMTRFKHRKVYSREKELFLRWKQGRSILELAEHTFFPPTLMASLILKNCDLSRKNINWLFKHLDCIENRRLRREVRKALEADYFFSPRAHEMQCKKGEMGEEIIRKWLDDREIPYCTEAEIRAQGDGKTPDFVLSDPIPIEDHMVRWIESKALFGDDFEHKHYAKKQFREYADIFGEGMVVYWYGYLEDLGSEDEGYLIKDHSFFGEYKEQTDELFNYLVYWESPVK